MNTEELLNTQIGIYRNIEYKSAPIINTIKTFLGLSKACIKTIENARKYSNRSNPEEDRLYKYYKQQLPVATLSCICGENKSIIKSTNPIIALDIDHLKEEDIPSMKSKLIKLPYVFLVMKSVSGKGLFALVYLSGTDKFLERFNALKDEMKSIGIDIDSACKNINRLRFISYDDKVAVKNFDQEIIPFQKIKYSMPVYDNILPDHKSTQQLFKSTKTHIYPDEGLLDTIEFKHKCIRYIIDKQLIKISSYDDWFYEARMIKSVFKDEGIKYFHEISKYNPGYKSEEDCNKLYSNLNDQPVEKIAHFYSILKNQLGKQWITEIKKYNKK